MILSLVLQLAISVPDSSARPVVPPRPSFVEAQQDTMRRRRPRAIEVGEWYHRRLVVHKALSYAMLPVFAAQYVAGNELFDEDQGKGDAPGWAKPVHQVGAASIAGIFGVNTVTGLWNLWDSRDVENHRWLRVTHSLVMLGADAAFAYTGIKLSAEAEHNGAARRQHRQVALYAIGVSVGSGVAMKIFNSR